MSYDEASGVCTVSQTEGEDARKPDPRPWTGKMIRDAEGAIAVFCTLAVCGLLMRAVRWHARCWGSMLRRHYLCTVSCANIVYDASATSSMHT